MSAPIRSIPSRDARTLRTPPPLPRASAARSHRARRQRAQIAQHRGDTAQRGRSRIVWHPRGIRHRRIPPPPHGVRRQQALGERHAARKHADRHRCAPPGRLPGCRRAPGSGRARLPARGLHPATRRHDGPRADGLLGRYTGGRGWAHQHSHGRTGLVAERVRCRGPHSFRGETTKRVGGPLRRVPARRPNVSEHALRVGIPGPRTSLQREEPCLSSAGTRGGTPGQSPE